MQSSVWLTVPACFASRFHYELNGASPEARVSILGNSMLWLRNVLRKVLFEG